jgi:hypothetical protein
LLAGAPIHHDIVHNKKCHHCDLRRGGRKGAKAWHHSSVRWVEWWANLAVLAGAPIHNDFVHNKKCHHSDLSAKGSNGVIGGWASMGWSESIGRLISLGKVGWWASPTGGGAH